MKKFIPTLLLCILIASCNKQNDNTQMPKTFTKKTLSVPLGGKFNALGFGYDITGEYASTNSIINKVLDVDAFDLANPYRITINNGTYQYGTNFSADNAQTFTGEHSATIKGDVSFAKIFKGTINATYNDSYKYSSRYVYSRFNLIVQQEELYINASESLLQNYLTPAFKQDIQNQSPDYIVSHYGTHVVVACVLGAKIDIMYRSLTSNTNRTDAASAGIDASINLLALSGSLNANLSYKSASSSDNYNSTLTYKTTGADPSKAILGSITFNGAPNSPITLDIKSWQNSSTLANSQLIDFSRAQSLIPIWEFIADPAKSAAVQAYVNQYLVNNSLQLLNDNYPTTNLYRYFQIKGIPDHMLTTSLNEVGGNRNWVLDKILGNTDGRQGRIYTSPAPGLVPLYRYFLTDNTHFATTNPGEVPKLKSDWFLGYVNQTQGLGEIPIYRFFARSKNVRGHIFVTDPDEYNRLSSNGDWTYEGIVGYISK